MVSAEQQQGSKIGEEEETTGSDIATGQLTADEARARFPAHVDAALKFVQDNRYDYGPKLRDVEMNWQVAGATELDDSLTRIFIDYSPLKAFRGRSGSEYVDVDSEGSVVARRQVRVPKENLPFVLIGLAAASVIALAAVQILVWFNPFEGGPELYVSGRTLYLRSELPRVRQHVEYQAPTGSGEFIRWAVSPSGDGTELVMVEVTVINATSGAVKMNVDRDAAELRIADSVGLKPVDILDRSYPVEEGASRWFVPDFRAMWGSYTLNRGEQLSGHLIFEAPAGSEFSEFRWSTGGDSPRVSYR